MMFTRLRREYPCQGTRIKGWQEKISDAFGGISHRKQRWGLGLNLGRKRRDRGDVVVNFGAGKEHP